MFELLRGKRPTQSFNGPGVWELAFQSNIATAGISNMIGDGMPIGEYNGLHYWYLMGKIFVFNPSTSVLSELTSHPDGITASTAILHNGDIYVLGGLGDATTGISGTGSRLQFHSGYLSNRFYIYHVNTGVWERKADFEVLSGEQYLDLTPNINDKSKEYGVRDSSGTLFYKRYVLLEKYMEGRDLADGAVAQRYDTYDGYPIYADPNDKLGTMSNSPFFGYTDAFKDVVTKGGIPCGIYGCAMWNEGNYIYVAGGGIRLKTAGFAPAYVYTIWWGDNSHVDTDQKVSAVINQTDASFFNGTHPWRPGIGLWYTLDELIANPGPFPSDVIDTANRTIIRYNLTTGHWEDVNIPGTTVHNGKRIMDRYNLWDISGHAPLNLNGYYNPQVSGIFDRSMAPIGAVSLIKSPAGSVKGIVMGMPINSTFNIVPGGGSYTVQNSETIYEIDSGGTVVSHKPTAVSYSISNVAAYVGNEIFTVGFDWAESDNGSPLDRYQMMKSINPGYSLITDRSSAAPVSWAHPDWADIDLCIPGHFSNGAIYFIGKDYSANSNLVVFKYTLN